MNSNYPEFESGCALVIGGSGGIGSAVCEQLAAAGSNVVLSYHSNQTTAGEVVALVERHGQRALALPVSLLETGSLDTAVEQALSQFEHIHSVVYAAGPPIEYLYINEITREEWARVINADVNGCFNLIEATLPHFRERKAAIEMLINGVAREEGRNGIRANCVGPGYIKAGLGITTVHDHTAAYVVRMEKAVPLKRAGEAVDVAKSVVFLLSENASYVTGVHIPVAGGLQLV